MMSHDEDEGDEQDGDDIQCKSEKARVLSPAFPQFLWA